MQTIGALGIAMNIVKWLSQEQKYHHLVKLSVVLLKKKMASSPKKQIKEGRTFDVRAWLLFDEVFANIEFRKKF